MNVIAVNITVGRWERNNGGNNGRGFYLDTNHILSLVTVVTTVETSPSC